MFAFLNIHMEILCKNKHTNAVYFLVLIINLTLLLCRCLKSDKIVLKAIVFILKSNHVYFKERLNIFAIVVMQKNF